MACFVNTRCCLKINHAFVTGATGFIGTQLTKKLVATGAKVTCLVRPQSNIQTLENLGCEFVYGDLRSDTLTLPGLERCDALFNVAATKNTANPKDMLAINPDATRNLFEAVLQSSATPRVVHVSSLAVCGPSTKHRPTVETDRAAPVSYYGRSKLESERIVNTYADRFPISIVRPPIVMGQGDNNGLKMFKLIEQFNYHLIPGLKDRQYSVTHVDDLVNALICVAKQGKSISSPSERDTAASGIYFASTEQLSYADLGRNIGLAMGRNHTRCLYIARPILWSIGAVNSLLAWATKRPYLLNLDKYQEVVAGDWTCSSKKLCAETDFDSPVSFAGRLKQTIQWYQENGWLDRHIQPHAHA